MKNEELNPNTTQEETQPQEEVGIDLSEKKEDIFVLSREKRAAIPLVPVKEIYLPYANKTVKLRKPSTRDVKAVANISNAELKTYYLVSNLTGLTMDEIDKLEYKEFKLLNEHLQSFL